MKKFIIFLIIIIVLIVIGINIGILDFSNNEENFANYSGYYFSKLRTDEKEIYVKIDEAITERKERAFLGVQDTETLTKKINKVLSAYFYDNPRCYYISNEYTLYTRNFLLFKSSSVKLNYTTRPKDLNITDREFENAIEEFLLRHVTNDMTDFEKEVAIHDALVEEVNYYENNYLDINTIPSAKHSAYAALVGKDAVCDGYSKAFKILLEEVGIESIIVGGSTGNIAHAWNLVKLDDGYYHVDVTSDKLEDDKKYVIHKYFNLTDSEIGKTHNIDTTFSLPKCEAKGYDYYTKTDCYISSGDNLYNKLDEIIVSQQSSNVLEIKVDERYNARRIIDTLYNLNFNNWRSSGKNSVSYHTIQDVYIFIK